MRSVPAGTGDGQDRGMQTDRQNLAREMVVEVRITRTRAGEDHSALPVKFSDTPGAVKHPAPLLGQHTREVLEGLGYSSAEIHKLDEDGAVLVAK